MNRRDFHEGVRINADLNRAESYKQDAYNRATNLAHKFNGSFQRQYGRPNPNPDIQRGDQVYHQNQARQKQNEFAKAVSPKKFQKYSKIVHDVKYSKHILARSHITPAKNEKVAWQELENQAKALKTGMKADQSEYHLASKLYKASPNDPSFKNTHFGKVYYNVNRRLNHGRNTRQDQNKARQRRIDARRHNENLDRKISPKHFAKYSHLRQDLSGINSRLAQDPHNSMLKALHHNRLTDAQDVKRNLQDRRSHYKLTRNLGPLGHRTTPRYKSHNIRISYVDGHRMGSPIVSRHEKFERFNRKVSPKHLAKYNKIQQNVHDLDNQLAQDPNNSNLRALRHNRITDAQDVRMDMQDRGMSYSLGKHMATLDPNSRSARFYKSVKLRNDPQHQAHVKSLSQRKHDMAVKMDKIVSPKQYKSYKTFNNLLKHSNQFDSNRSAYQYKVNSLKDKMHQRFGEYKLGEKMKSLGAKDDYFNNAPFGKIYNDAQKRMNPTNHIKKQFHNSLNSQRNPYSDMNHHMSHGAITRNPYSNQSSPTRSSYRNNVNVGTQPSFTNTGIDNSRTTGSQPIADHTRGLVAHSGYTTPSHNRRVARNASSQRFGQSFRARMNPNINNNRVHGASFMSRSTQSTHFGSLGSQLNHSHSNRTNRRIRFNHRGNSLHF